jgi:protein gp37
MGKNSGISWTDHTFNPWWGCVKVSAGCEHCYAETQANRFAPNLWGPGSDRRMFSNAHWNEPYIWNKEAKLGGPAKVFSGSMCDVFERHPALIETRVRLFRMMELTPYLRWLLLTKRPENIREMVPIHWLTEGFPSTVWIGTTVEKQEYISRLGYFNGLMAHKFVSVEPMIGPVKILPFFHQIDWVIVGGESGKHCRPMNIDWALSLKEECHIGKVPFFFKQIGGYPDKQDQIAFWPEELQVQEFPDFTDVGR